MGTKALDSNSYSDFDISNFDYESVELQPLYQAVKTFTDKLSWKLAKQHPDVDFTVRTFNLLFLMIIQQPKLTYIERIKSFCLLFSDHF